MDMLLHYHIAAVVAVYHDIVAGCERYACAASHGAAIHLSCVDAIYMDHGRYGCLYV